MQKTCNYNDLCISTWVGLLLYPTICLISDNGIRRNGFYVLRYMLHNYTNKSCRSERCDRAVVLTVLGVLVVLTGALCAHGDSAKGGGVPSMLG